MPQTHTQTEIPPAPTWELDSIFPGGSSSAELKTFRQKLKSQLDTISTEVTKLPEQIDDSSLGAWVEFILAFQSTLADIELVQAFAGCLTAQNVKDAEAHSIEAEGDEYFARWKKVLADVEALSLKQSDEQWKKLTSHDKLKDVAFFLDQLRWYARSKMPIEKEKLALELAVNGYHAWNRLYDKMAGDLRSDFKEDGEVKQLSMGQLATKMSSPDRDVRRRAFDAMTEGWERRADLSGMGLNALAGFRLALYKNRGWESTLFEPLVLARLKEDTLNAMWNVISREKKRLHAYIEAKKKLLGIDKFRWYDEFAPCGSSDTLFSFDDAGEFIARNLGSFSDDMAAFTKNALKNRWVEAEDRGGKAGGAFCTGFGPVRQSRVFMTYGGSFDNLLTLAHELGHAYHQQVITEKPYLAQQYPMPLAETASIFNETLVTDAALQQSTDPQEQLMLLDQKLQAAYVMFTDIHARFLFEKEFYARRAEGTLQTSQLNDLMVEAQKEAFAGMLADDGYHPLFWASKLHFYITEAPFYNFPYTFGFLFAGGVYDRARSEGKKFADGYRTLLAETGSMMTEDLAKKHLGVDLTGEEFWSAAVDRALADIDDFVKLAERQK